jgi:hypothetical protein
MSRLTIRVTESEIRCLLAFSDDIGCFPLMRIIPQWWLQVLILELVSLLLEVILPPQEQLRG